MALVNLTIVVFGGADPADAIKIDQLTEKLKSSAGELGKVIETNIVRGE